MEQAADQWLQSSHGKVLAEVPYIGPQADALRKRLRDAYIAGFRDGRKRDDE